MKINWRKIWKVLRVIGEIGLAVYGVIASVIAAMTDDELQKEKKHNLARKETLADIEFYAIDPRTDDSEFRNYVWTKIGKCNRNLKVN